MFMKAINAGDEVMSGQFSCRGSITSGRMPKKRMTWQIPVLFAESRIKTILSTLRPDVYIFNVAGECFSVEA